MAWLTLYFGSPLLSFLKDSIIQWQALIYNILIINHCGSYSTVHVNYLYICDHS